MIPTYTYQPGIPLDEPNDGVFPEGYASGASAFPVGGFLYSVVNSLTNSSIEVLRSADRGITWTELDSSHHPQNANLSSLCYFYSGQNPTKIFVVYVNANLGPDNFQTIVFNTDTGLWDAPVSSGIPTSDVLAVFVRVDNTMAVIHEPRCDGAISGLEISVLNVATWTGYDLGIGAVNAGMPPPANGSFLDGSISTGFDGSTIYCFYNTGQASPYFYACFFQSFSIANGFSNFFQFPNTAVAINPDLRVSNGSPMGQPAISGTTIYLPVARSSYSSGEVNYPSLYVSLNAGATWTEMPLQESTDPASQGTGITQDSVIFAGQALLVQGQLWIVYSAQLPLGNGVASYIRLCQLPQGMNPLIPSNWTAETLQTLSTYSTNQFATFSWPTVSVLTNPPDVLLTSELYNGIESLAYWFGNFFPAIPNLPVVAGPIIALPYCIGPYIGPKTRSFF